MSGSSRFQVCSQKGSAQKRYYQSLDLWRGIACLSVIIFHVSNAFPIGANPTVEVLLGLLWLGVPMFFVISGYCIAAACSFAQEPYSFRRFIGRRVRRIFPPYLTILSLITLASCIPLIGHKIADPFTLTAGQWLGNLTLTERWLPHLLGGNQSFILQTAWTLCYEEQFYVLCGLALLIFRNRFFLGITIISILSLPLTLLNWSGHMNLQGWFFDGYWFQFSAGVLVYRACHAETSRERNVHLALLFAALMTTVALRTNLTESLVWGYSRSAFLNGTMFAFCFAGSLVLLKPFDNYFHALRLLRPIRTCGVMCYSLYLVHAPLITGLLVVHSLSIRSPFQDGVLARAITAIATVGICVVAGRVFYEVVERRFLSRQRSSLLSV